MIIVRLYTGQVLEFPDGTPESVIRAAAERATQTGTAATGEDVVADRPRLSQDAALASGGLEVPARRDPESEPTPTPTPERSPEWWRSVTGSFDSKARQLELQRAESFGPEAMTRLGFQDKETYYLNPSTDERVLKRHQVGDLPQALDRGYRPETATDRLHAAYEMEGRPVPTGDEMEARSEWVRGVPSRVMGSMSGLALPFQAAEAAGRGLKEEARNLITGDYVGRPTGEGLHRGVRQGWQESPITQGAGAVNEQIVEPARERFIEAATLAGMSPERIAAADTGQMVAGELLNPGNYIGLEMLRTGAQMARTTPAALSRRAAQESVGGARSLDEAGIVTREFGRGSAPSEIAQGKAARSGEFLPGANEPLLYRDPGGNGGVEWKGVIPDAIRNMRGEPWRTYGGADLQAQGIGRVPLERPSGPEPRPRNVEGRQPLPMEVMGGNPEQQAKIGGLWDYASRRYPTIASRVRELRIGSEAFFEPENGMLQLTPDADLGQMMHEMTHVAQGARGVFDRTKWDPESGTRVMNLWPDEKVIEPTAMRAGDVYSRIPQPQPRPVSGAVPENAAIGSVVDSSMKVYGSNDISERFAGFLKSNGIDDPEHYYDLPLQQRTAIDRQFAVADQGPDSVAWSAYLLEHNMRPDDYARLSLPDRAKLETEFRMQATQRTDIPDPGANLPNYFYDRDAGGWKVEGSNQVFDKEWQAQQHRDAFKAYADHPQRPYPYAYPTHEGWTLLDKIAGVEPRPLGFKGEPLPLPPLRGIQPEQVEKAWAAVSARYPALASRIRRIEGADDWPRGAMAEYGPILNERNLNRPPWEAANNKDFGGVLFVNSKEPLAIETLAHEIVHVAQGARGQIPRPSFLSKTDLARMESYASRAGNASSSSGITGALEHPHLPPRYDWLETDQLAADLDDVIARRSAEEARLAGMGRQAASPDLVRLELEESAIRREIAARKPQADSHVQGVSRQILSRVGGEDPEDELFRAYADQPNAGPLQGQPIPAAIAPVLPEEQAARAMGWLRPSGSPSSVGPPVQLPEFQTNIAAQLGGDEALATWVIQNSDAIYKEIGPPQTWDTLEEMAVRAGTTKEDLLANSSHWQVMSPELRLRLLYIAKDNESKIQALQAKLVKGEATDIDKADILRRIDSRSDFIKLGAKTGSAYGRALNSLKMEARLSLGDDQLLRQQLYRQYSKQLDAEKPLMDALAHLDPNNPEELQAFLRAVNKPSFREYLQEYWVSSILSGPASHERNLIGNTVNMLMENMVVRPVAAGFDAARVAGAVGAGAERAIYLKETSQAAVGMVRGIRKGAERGWEVIKRGYDPETMKGKLFPVRSAFARSQNPVVRDVVGPVVTMPLRLLAASDALFKTMNWNAEIYAQAARIASKAGLSGDDFAKEMAHLVGNPTDEMIDAADNFALKATFNDEVSAFGKSIMNLRDLPGVAEPKSAIGKAGLETYRGLAGFVLPFIKIADRLMVRGFEYSPIGTLRSVAARQTGNFVESADLAARSAIGSVVMAYAASLAMEGRLTAGAPTDEAEKAAFFGAGKQAWSVRTDDGIWIPYGGLQPVGTPFALTASFWKGWTENGESPTDERIAWGAQQVGAYVTDQSYMDGLSKLIEAISGGKGQAGRAGADLISNTAWGFAPYSGLTRSVAKGIDPRVIDADRIADRLWQNVPGISLGMDARLTPWGEEVVPVGGRLRSGLAPGSILLPSREKSNPLDKELDRLGMPLGYVGKTLSDKLGKGKSRGRWTLTPDEYHYYQQTAGRTTRKLLERLYAKEGYPSWDIERQREETEAAIGKAREYARIQMVRRHRGLGWQ